MAGHSRSKNGVGSLAFVPAIKPGMTEGKAIANQSDKG
jgi:hypothetical protein